LARRVRDRNAGHGNDLFRNRPQEPSAEAAQHLIAQEPRHLSGVPIQAGLSRPIAIFSANTGGKARILSGSLFRVDSQFLSIIRVPIATPT
jgi:hypothetical protein